MGGCGKEKCFGRRPALEEIPMTTQRQAKCTRITHRGLRLGGHNQVHGLLLEGEEVGHGAALRGDAELGYAEVEIAQAGGVHAAGEAARGGRHVHDPVRRIRVVDAKARFLRNQLKMQKDWGY